MIQIIFFSLLILSLLAGVLAYFNPHPKQINPLGYVMKNSGYESAESTNYKRIQQINMFTDQGLTKIRKQMDDLAVKQSSFEGMIQDQQEILKSASENARGVLLEAQKQGMADKDIEQLQALTGDIDNQQRLLVSRGQYLLTLNNQLTQSRKLVSDQIDLANINTQSSMQSLAAHYDLLQDQAKNYLDHINQYNQEVNNQMNEIGNHFDNLANNTSFGTYVQQQQIKERIERMLDKVHEEMQRVAQVQQKNKDLMQASQDNLAASEDRLHDSMQRTQDLIEQEREKEQERQLSAPQNNP